MLSGSPSRFETETFCSKCSMAFKTQAEYRQHQKQHEQSHQQAQTKHLHSPPPTKPFTANEQEGAQTPPKLEEANPSGDLPNVNALNMAKSTIDRFREAEASSTTAQKQPASQKERVYQACTQCRNRRLICSLWNVINPHDPPCASCKRNGTECYSPAEWLKQELLWEDGLEDRVSSETPTDFPLSDTAEEQYAVQPSSIDSNTISYIQSLLPAGDTGQGHSLMRQSSALSSKRSKPEQDNSTINFEIQEVQDIMQREELTLKHSKHSKSYVKQFKCPYPGCEQDSFALRRTAERHIRSAHSPRKFFACTFPGCDRTLTRRDNCNLHMAQKHRRLYNSPGLLNKAAAKSPDSNHHERLLELKTQHKESEVIEWNTIPSRTERFNMTFTAENSSHSRDDWFQSAISDGKLLENSPPIHIPLPYPHEKHLLEKAKEHSLPLLTFIPVIYPPEDARCEVCEFQPWGNPQKWKSCLANHMKRCHSKSLPQHDTLRPNEQESELSLQDCELTKSMQPNWKVNVATLGEFDREEIMLDREVAMEKEMPFTDSGYASASHQNLPLNVPSSIEQPRRTANANPSIKMDEVDGEDTTTLYSAASNLAPTHAQHYMDELCSNIYSKLEEFFDDKSWSTQSEVLLEALPWLIKAFAIKIGHDSSAQVNQEIMYFIHKRHKEVIVQLEAMFRHENDDRPNRYRANSGNMSLLDKMDMWNNKAEEDCSVVETDDLFMGVNDDEDVVIDAVDLPIYRKTILNSAAYNWLLASLRKEFFLQWSKTQRRTMIDSIRQRILDKLPTGTISKRRALNAYEVKFDLQWGDIGKESLEHELFERLLAPEPSLAEFIIVTGSPEEAQALNVKQYLSQTWPTNGLQLLDALQKAIIHPDHHYSAILPDNTQYEVNIYGSHLTIMATGPAHFIAECGEQLAWLRAALLNKSGKFVGYCTPSITRYSVGRVVSLSKRPQYRGYCDIGFEIARFMNLGESAPRSHNYWQDLVGESIVIMGFPISRRPEDFPGIELDFNTLLHILQADKATIANGIVVVKGSKRTLQLIKHVDSVFLWHQLHSLEFCSCCKERHFRINDAIFCRPIDLYDLKVGRHIFSKCANLQALCAENTDIGHRFEKPCLSKNKYFENQVPIEINSIDDQGNAAHNPTAINPNRSLWLLPESQIGEIVSKSLITSRVLYSVSLDDLSSLDEEYAEHNSLLINPNVLEADSQSLLAGGSPSTFTGGSPGEPLDSDFLSISDSSEHAEPLDGNDPVYPVLSAVLSQLISGFRTITQFQLSPGDNGGVSTTRASSITSSTTRDTSKKCRKRIRESEDDDDDAGHDGFLRPPRKRINSSQRKSLQTSFACPYLKVDPIKHRNCCANQLSRIRDVKQHLTWRHTPERYCQRCLRADFRDDQSLERHMDLNTCPRNDPSVLEGISYQRQRQLSRKSNSSLSEVDQWFKIWEIIFPGRLRPGSPYMDAGFSVEMRLFREYCSHYGPAALREQLESNPVFLVPEITVEQRGLYLDRVIAQGINSLFEEYWLSTHSLNSQGDRSVSSSELQSNNQPQTRFETPISSIADSGVALGSQPSSSETPFQSVMLPRSPGVVDWGYQPATAENQIQGASTMREDAAALPQSQGQNLPNVSIDGFFEDQMYGSGLPIFDPFQTFGTESTLNDFSQHIQDYDARDQGEMGDEY